MSLTKRRCRPGFQSSRLQQAVKGMLLLSALTVSAAPYAESDADTLSLKHSYHIGGGSLSHVLSQFATTSGLLFVAEARLTEGKNSAGLDGEYTVEEGFRKLLAGSGLTHAIASDKTVTLKIAPPQSQSGVAAMPAVTVVGKTVYDSTDPYNENYSLPNTSTATKTDTPVMETPYSVQVVPRAVIQDQQGIQVGDAIKNVSGVFQGFTFGGYAEEFMIRGFQTNYNNYLDGFRWSSNRLPLANVQSVEVVKGAASNLHGRIEPGGMINVLTKRPQATPYYSLEQRFGSYDLYQTLGDATGALNQDASLLYRVNFEYLDKNSFRDFAFTDRVFVAPSLTWKISDRTQLDVDFLYSNEDTLEDHGVVASNITHRPIDIPISRYLGEPSTDKAKTEIYNTAVTLSHAFSEDWKLRTKFDMQRRKGYDFQHPGPVLNETTGMLHRAFYGGDFGTDTYFATMDLTGKFDVLATRHEVLVGWDHYSIDGLLATTFLPPAIFGGPVQPINIYNPVYGQSGVSLTNLQHNGFTKTETETTGVYFQDQITLFDKLHILGGGRYDWVAQISGSSGSSLADASAHKSQISNERFNPRVGVFYQAWPWLSVYGNYVESLGAANSARDPSDNILQPEIGEQYEGGFKTEFFDKRLLANVAFYHLTKQNLAVPIIGTQYSQAIGQARSQGIEVDVSGRVTENLNLIATYAYTDAIVEKGANAGMRLWNVPRNAGSLWAKYDFQQSVFKGLTLGAGFYFQDQKEGDTGNNFQLPGYGRVDALLKYQLPIAKARTTLQFNVENLLDQKYYASTVGWSNSFVNPGAPRTFIGSVKVEY